MPKHTKKPQTPFTDVELEFMEIVWELDDPTPDEIGMALRERGRDISVGSIRNVLAIMMRKGFLSRRKDGRAYRYSATVKRDEAGRSIIHGVVDRIFKGSESQVVAALLGSGGVDDEELAKIRSMIDAYDRKGEPE